jgi:maltose alpha-D-glucosyltransferase/alpha-amylase
MAREAIGSRSHVAARFEAITGLRGPLRRTRIHGDYHLGQVLKTRDDFVIVDFEGEPARSLEERRAKQSPLKDVAGMLRSLSYAAESVRLPAGRAATVADVDAWMQAWQSAAGGAFLCGYRETAGIDEVVPRDPAEFATLLEAFLLDKALYELRYELDNRPSWIGIPLRGLLSLIGAGGADRPDQSR